VYGWLGLAAIGWGQSYDLPFFGRAEDLDPHEIWSMRIVHAGSGCEPDGMGGCAHDLSVLRWDADTNNWVGIKSGGSASSAADRLTFGIPVYSMTDGINASQEEHHSQH
jgi:hypothetical protein